MFSQKIAVFGSFCISLCPAYADADSDLINCVLKQYSARSKLFLMDHHFSMI